jgi:hypothetical protein
MDEIADRVAITGLYARYCWALSTHDWDAIDSLMLPSAWIDATAFGGPALPWSSFKGYVAEALGRAESFYTATSVFADVRGTTASAVAAFVAHLSFPDGDEGRVVIDEGGWFLDELRHDDNGWVVESRVEKLGFMATVEVPAAES